MAIKKDLSVEYLGVKFENPFCLSSSPVDDSYEKCSKAFDNGWAGVFYKSFAKFKGVDCSPRFDSIGKESMKGEESRLALWDALRAGVIDTVATDHCPFQQAEKDWGKDDFTKIPNGCDGVECRYPYLLSAANEGLLTFEKAVEVCCTNPARLFGCAPQKGTIAVG